MLTSSSNPFKQANIILQTNINKNYSQSKRVFIAKEKSSLEQWPSIFIRIQALQDVISTSTISPWEEDNNDSDVLNICKV